MMSIPPRLFRMRISGTTTPLNCCLDRFNRSVARTGVECQSNCVRLTFSEGRYRRQRSGRGGPEVRQANAMLQNTWNNACSRSDRTWRSRRRCRSAG